MKPEYRIKRLLEAHSNGSEEIAPVTLDEAISTMRDDLSLIYTATRSSLTGGKYAFVFGIGSYSW